MRALFPFEKIRSPLWLLLKGGATALFLWYLFSNPNLSPAHFKAILSAAEPHFLALSFGAAILLLWLNIIRWRNFLRFSGLADDTASAAKTFLAGSLLGFISPGRAAEFGRGYLMANVSVKETALLTIAEKAYFIFFTVLFSLLAALFGRSAFPAVHGGLYLAVLTALLALTLVSGYCILKGEKLAFKGLFKHFTTQEPHRFLLLTQTNMLFVLMIFQFYFILLAFGEIRLFSAFVTFSLTLTILTFFPVSLGNLGVREGCFIFFLNNMQGYPETAAFSAGIVIFIENILFPSLLGLWVVVTAKLKPDAEKAH